MVVFEGGNMQRIRSPPIKVLLVDTAVSRSTRNLVNIVSSQLESRPDIIKPILSSIDGISKACVGVFESIDETKGDEAATRAKYEELEQLIDYNHSLLKSIRVSHPKLERIVKVAGDNGLHAKLTGAGGGGFAYILLPPYVKHDTVKHVKKLLQDDGFRCWETMLDPNGVSVQAAD